jgi:hypothetical protein
MAGAGIGYGAQTRNHLFGTLPLCKRSEAFHLSSIANARVARRQSQPPPQISQGVGDQTQPEPYFIRPESMTAQPRHLDRQLAFFDPSLRCPTLVVEPHHRPAG